MNIILGKEAAQKLEENYIILELERVRSGDKEVPAFCVVRYDLIPIHELQLIEQYKALHDDFLAGYHKKDYHFCSEAVEHLRGKFGGELDSFYDELMARVT